MSKVGLMVKAPIHVTFIIQEQVCLSWRVSPESLHIANSLLSMNVLVHCCSIITIHGDGGCHVILLKMTYWGGASVSGKCACGMTNSCANPSYGCNCDKEDGVWREDSGLLTDKTRLPVKQLRFGDVAYWNKGYHSLGKLKCYGIP